MSTAFPRCGRMRPLPRPRRGALAWEKKSRRAKMMERNGPSRTASGRPPRRVVCRSSDSRSSRRGWGWWRARRWTTSALRERVRHPPCSYPSWEFEDSDVAVSAWVSSCSWSWVLRLLGAMTLLLFGRAAAPSPFKIGQVGRWVVVRLCRGTASARLAAKNRQRRGDFPPSFR